jgi:hypothetical protein
MNIRMLFLALAVFSAVVVYDADHGWEPDSPCSLDEAIVDEDGAIDEEAADSQAAGDEMFGYSMRQPCICMTELRRDGAVRPHDAHNQQYCGGLLSRLRDASATRP